MSILLYGYEQLSSCISQVEQMRVKINTSYLINNL
jgi:hypothetical protein